MFNHTELSTEKLQERLGELLAADKIPHSTERMEQIGHELACLVFELDQRSTVEIPSDV